jgi:hypothetical protein
LVISFGINYAAAVQWAFCLDHVDEEANRAAAIAVMTPKTTALAST